MVDDSPTLPMSDNERSDDIIRSTAESRLTEFLGRSKKSSIGIHKSSKGASVAIVERPWGDSSLAIRVPESESSIVDALNSCLLPERLSAVYHIRDKKLEIIWTAFKLAPMHKEVMSRRFYVDFNEKTYCCRFDVSSVALGVIAEHTLMVSSPLSTNFRNLASHIYSKDNASIIASAMGTPVSFFVEGIEWEEDDVIEFVYHLNFYMKYFDSSSPVVMIHQATEHTPGKERFRDFRVEFPSSITMRTLDENMLAFWNGMTSGNANEATQFIVYFRIIEYAAVFYVNEAVRQKLKSLIRSPSFKADMDNHLDRMAEALMGMPENDHMKLKATIERHANVDVIWPRIEANKQVFSREVEFDGGFLLPGFIAKKATALDFPSAIEQFVQNIKNIRNGLSHGRDRSSQGVIQPTANNLNLLRPWVEVMALIAGDALISR